MGANTIGSTRCQGQGHGRKEESVLGESLLESNEDDVVLANDYNICKVKSADIVLAICKDCVIFILFRLLPT